MFYSKRKGMIFFWGLIVCALISAVFPMSLATADTYPTWTDSGNTYNITFPLDVRTPWYAYVKSGDTLSYRFEYDRNYTHGVNNTVYDGLKFTVTVYSPNGVYNAIGAGCTTGTSTQACSGSVDVDTQEYEGIWQIVVNSNYDDSRNPAPNTVRGDGTGGFAPWHIRVRKTGLADTSANAEPGRVYTNPMRMNQRTTASGRANVSVFFLRNDGYAYRADYFNYHGIESSFHADAFGITKVGECTSGYRSIFNTGGGVRNPVNYNEPKSEGYDLAPQTCGGSFRVYLTSPISGEQPDTADIFTCTQGSISNNNCTAGTKEETWLRPEVDETTIGNITFTTDNTHGDPNPPGSSVTTPLPFDGEISFETSNYIGNVEVQIVGSSSVNTCDFSANNVRKIRQSVVDPTPNDITLSPIVSKIDFDGKDGSTQKAPITSNFICIRVSADHKGELHMVNSDVEDRSGGIVIMRLNGSAGADTSPTHVFWDDTSLNDDRCSKPAHLSQENGVASGGGVHGWGNAGCINSDPPDTPSYTGYGPLNSWGNGRRIDDWTYDLGSARTSDTFTRAQPRPKLKIEKTFADDELRVGHSGNMTIKVTNTGDYITTGTITVKDVMLDDLEANSATITNGNADDSCTVPTDKKMVTCTSTKNIQPTRTDFTDFIEITINFTPRKAHPGLASDPDDDPDDDPDIVHNTAYVSGGGDQGCPPGNTELACSSSDTIKTVTPELHILKTMDSGIVGETENFVVGHRGKYILTVTNQGTIDTDGTVTVTDTIPEHFVIGEITSDPDDPGVASDCVVTGQTITCTRNEVLGLYDSETDTGDKWIITVSVMPTAVIDGVENEAYVYGGDDQVCTDQASAGTENGERCDSEIIRDLRHPELTVEKKIETKYTTDDASKLPVILLGEIARYTVKVTNIGNYRTMTESYVVDYLPSEVELVLDKYPLSNDCRYDREDHTVTCLVPAGLEPGHQVNFEIYVKSRAISGTVANTAVVDGDDLVCVSQTAAMNVRRCYDTTLTPARAPKLVIKKTSSLQSITMGDEITFYLSIRNNGNYRTVSKYRITDKLPDNLSFLNVEVTGIRNDRDAGDNDGDPRPEPEVTCGNQGNNVECNMTEGLNPSGEVTIAITAKAISAGMGVKNVATVAGDNCTNGGFMESDCISESICTTEDERWLSNNDEYNDYSRCSSETEFDIVPEPPRSGGVGLVYGAASAVLLFGIGIGLMRKRTRDNKSNL